MTMPTLPRRVLTALLASSVATASLAQSPPVARTANGRVQGVALASGIARFAGIPFAAPPVGALRWTPPRPAAAWTGVRPAGRFADQCMQARVFSDMVFRNSGTSEDCLYLNVWTKAAAPAQRMPVLVYIYGGGFIGGDGSEPRYDGEAMAKRGIVVVTLSYRLGIFGFFAHPELAKESPTGATGNYGLMDQTAALRWVKANIAQFGGDPARVTIAGESAGSYSVTAQMASPQAKGLFVAAIGESGSFFGTARTTATAAVLAAAGENFGRVIGAPSLAQLRALSSHEMLAAATRPGVATFGPNIDGAFLPESPTAIFAAGRQAKVPLLAGWNSEEARGEGLVPDLTPAGLDAALVRVFGSDAPEARAIYAGNTPAEIAQAATDVASDQFIAYATWRWLEEQAKVAPVFRYYFSRARPPLTTPAPARSAAASASPWQAIAYGAPHSTEIEYVMGNLPLNTVYAWTPEDHAISTTSMAAFEHFVKTGDPNGAGVPAWPVGRTDASGSVSRMRFDVTARVETEPRARYLFLQRWREKH